LSLLKPDIEKLKAKQDVAGLIQALKRKRDLIVRKNAAIALGELGDGRTIQPLIQTLNDNKETVRDAASKALEQIGEPAVRPLIEALNDKEEFIRSGSARILGFLKSEIAVGKIWS